MNNFRVIVIFCISVLLFIPVSLLFASEIIFREDFSNNDNNWPIEDDEYGKTSIVNLFICICDTFSGKINVGSIPRIDRAFNSAD